MAQIPEHVPSVSTDPGDGSEGQHSDSGAALLGQVVSLLDARFPPSTAEEWDRVGLSVGDPGQPVRRVLFAVDPTLAVVDEAIAWGADLLVTHHPLMLRGVYSVAADTLKGSVVHKLIRGGCALYSAHTNADAAEGGVADALADLIGVTGRHPLVPVPGADPAVGIGRVGNLEPPMTLRALAERVAAALPATAQGVRVAGELDNLVSTVAVLAGSGDSLLGLVRDAGADVYITSDLKHHPALDAREQADIDTAQRGQGFDVAPSPRPALIDTAHFASEWPWLRYVARDLVHDLARGGTTVETRISVLRTDPWTARFASPESSELCPPPMEGNPL
jgi:dinuclear metal center YbgI/SA1388 family protein